MGYSEARGPLTYEKNLKSKFSCQTPFNSHKNDYEFRLCNNILGWRPAWNLSVCDWVFVHVFHCHRKKIKENVQINPVRIAEKSLHMVSRLDGMHLILTKLNGLDLNRIKLLKCGKAGRQLIFSLLTLCVISLVQTGPLTYESPVTIIE